MPGTWDFLYFQGSLQNSTIIPTEPSNCERSSTTYTFFGYKELYQANGNMWKVGLPKSKEVKKNSSLIEFVGYEWQPSPWISYQNYVLGDIGYDTEIFVPLMSNQTITREGNTYSTSYSSYDSYGNPTTISEIGDRTRTTSKSYWYNTAKNIVQNKPSSETVSGSFIGSFTTNYFYDNNDTNDNNKKGNLTSIKRYEVVTNYAYTNGNLSSETDANNKTTSYEWTNGRISKITKPISDYIINRTVNTMGTIASEKDGNGYETDFTYDDNLRLTRTTPPAGNYTSFEYDYNSSWKSETRDQFYTYTYFDGLGRNTGSQDSKGITTTVRYSSCGLKESSESNIGDKTEYDNFGRTKKVIHKDGSYINYSYLGSSVIVTDEANNNTYLFYAAFGHPDEKWLFQVTDADQKYTSYNYNALGSLTSTAQGNMARIFTYNSKNFLIAEEHPERGTITYGRDNVGNMIWKQLAGESPISYSHDAINRLTGINFGTGQLILNMTKRITGY